MISLVACVNQSADKPLTPTDNNEDVIITTASEISGIVATTAAATKKEGTPQKPLGDSYGGGDGTPPIMVAFDSAQDINLFIEAANGTEAKFEEYAEKTDLYYIIDQKVAQAMAHNMEISYFPTLSSKLTEENFYAIYYLERNEFDVNYRSGNVTYSFVYRYNESSIPDIKQNQALVKQDVKLDAYSLDLYEGNECLVGYFLEDSVLVQVVIYTDDFENASLDTFKIVPVASVK